MAPYLPNILSYLPLGQCSPTAITCSSWRDGTNAYGNYRDLRDSVPWQLYKPHQNRVIIIIIIMTTIIYCYKLIVLLSLQFFLSIYLG